MPSPEDVPAPEPLDLDAIRSRLNADLTPGPWEWADTGLRYVKQELRTAGPWKPYAATVLRLHGEMPSAADADFIAAARTDVPALIAEVARLALDHAQARGEATALARERDAYAAQVRRLAGDLLTARPSAALKLREERDCLAATVERVRRLAGAWWEEIAWQRRAYGDGSDKVAVGRLIGMQDAHHGLTQVLDADGSPTVDTGTTKPGTPASGDPGGPTVTVSPDPGIVWVGGGASWALDDTTTESTDGPVGGAAASEPHHVVRVIQKFRLRDVDPAGNPSIELLGDATFEQVDTTTEAGWKSVEPRTDKDELPEWLGGRPSGDAKGFVGIVGPIEAVKPWACPVESHNEVEWDGAVWSCTTPGCLRASDNERGCNCELYNCAGECCGAGNCTCTPDAATEAPDGR